MSAIQVAAVLAAMVVAFWPQLARLGDRLAFVRPRPVDDTPTYLQSMADLASVRLRLRSTDLLDAERKAAIDALTLALVEGSDV